jgi:DNA-binding NtrC family response regulator
VAMKGNKKNGKVLIVDDNHEFLGVVEKIFRRRGFDILTAFDGSSAQRILSGNTEVAVVVLDVKLPDIDGYDLAQMIKCTHPDIEIIILTGYGSLMYANMFLRKKIYAYFCKPCDMDELTFNVGNALDSVALAKGSL